MKQIHRRLPTDEAELVGLAGSAQTKATGRKPQRAN
jgi:hypothetical protein